MGRVTTIYLVLVIHGVALAQSTTAPRDQAIISQDGFRARVADRELRAAFRAEHRVVVREEVPGASAIRVEGGEHLHVSPDLFRRRTVMIAIPLIIIVGVAVLKMSRRGKSLR
jgi:hypothetical protein